jgi:hypothetical protein
MAMSANQRAMLVAAGLLVLLLFSCCGCLAFFSWKTRREQDQFGSLAAVCDGRASPDAAAPTGPVRVVVMMHDRRGWRVSMGMTPDDTEPETLGETTHVLCVEEDRDVVGECEIVSVMGNRELEGTERMWPRTRFRAQVRLVRARDAVEVVSDVLLGPMPDTCEQHPRPGQHDFETRALRFDDLEEWLPGALARSR